MLNDQMEAFIKDKCGHKGHWCNGKHIPVMKKTTKKSVNEYTIFTNEDLSKARDITSCVFFQDNRCVHPDNPKNK